MFFSNMKQSSSSLYPFFLKFLQTRSAFFFFPRSRVVSVVSPPMPLFTNIAMSLVSWSSSRWVFFLCSFNSDMMPSGPPLLSVLWRLHIPWLQGGSPSGCCYIRPIDWWELFCCLGGCCFRASFSHASLTVMPRVLREYIRRFKARTMSLYVALVRPARFVECAKKGLFFRPCFPLFLCLLPLNKFFLGGDVGAVQLLYIDLHFLRVWCLHAHVCAFQLRLFQVSFVRGDI